MVSAARRMSDSMVSGGACTFLGCLDEGLRLDLTLELRAYMVINLTFRHSHFIENKPMTALKSKVV